MRTTERPGACAALMVLLCACAGDTPADGRNGAPVGMGPRAGSGAPGGAAGVGSFGNTDASVTTPVMPVAGAGGGVAATDAGTCVVGQFCAPTAPDPENCGTLEFEPDVEVTQTPGNLLVIFDQSQSMSEPWASFPSKLAAAQMALVNALTPLQNLLTIGAIFFPTTACLVATPMGGAVAPIDQAPQIPFTTGPEFLTAWNQHWAATQLQIGTPMNEAFDRADVAIQAAVANMTLTGALAVVAFTDGDPTCLPDAMLSGTPTLPEPERAAQWLTQNIKTYVVGLPGAQGATLLPQIAQSGGSMTLITPENPMDLETRLREVVSETVKTGFNSCSMTINPIPDVPDELLMIVDEPGVGQQQVARDQGWSLAVGGGEARVEITGALCEAAMNGRFESIKFQYACPEAPPPPPLPPIE